MNKLKLSNPKIYYNNSSNYYGLYHQNILYPPPLAARTGIYSLWIASFLGYDKIYFLGLDNTLFRLFSVDHMNRLLYGDTHFYSDGGVPGQSSKKSTVAEKLFSYSALFGSMEKIRFGSKAKIYNLDPNGYVDAFEKLSTLNCRLDNL